MFQPTNCINLGAIICPISKDFKLPFSKRLSLNKAKNPGFFVYLESCASKTNADSNQSKASYQQLWQRLQTAIFSASSALITPRIKHQATAARTF